MSGNAQVLCACRIRNLFSLDEARELPLRVYYPNICGQLVLRTDLDWDKDVLPTAIDPKDSFAEFKLETAHPFVYLKPCLRTTQGCSVPQEPIAW
jgi:hypothetical protein